MFSSCELWFNFHFEIWYQSLQRQWSSCELRFLFNFEDNEVKKRKKGSDKYYDDQNINKNKR